MSFRPEIERRKTRRIMVGNVPVGGDAPIAVQSMTNTDTCDVDATVGQIEALQNAGADIVRVHDGDVEHTPLEEVVRQFAPEVVGITANTTQIMAAWRDAELIKSLVDAVVVLGGPHPTTLPEESAAKPGVDVVVRGEGEMTWMSRVLPDPWSGIDLELFYSTEERDFHVRREIQSVVLE